MFLSELTIFCCCYCCLPILYVDDNSSRGKSPNSTLSPLFRQVRRKTIDCKHRVFCIDPMNYIDYQRPITNAIKYVYQPVFSNRRFKNKNEYGRTRRISEQQSRIAIVARANSIGNVLVVRVLSMSSDMMSSAERKNEQSPLTEMPFLNVKTRQVIFYKRIKSALVNSPWSVLG